MKTNATLRKQCSRLFAVIFFLSNAIPGKGQVYVPPDYYGDEDRGVNGYRENGGQVIGTNGYQASDVLYYAERTPLGIYLLDKAQVSFTLAALHHDSITPDTLFRVDMDMSGGSDPYPTPVGDPAFGVANYYMGAFEAEQVKAYHRVVYEDVWDYTDLHFYHGSTGPRMSYVVRPGGDPGDIEITFTGQDSINVDWQGDLKVYLGDKWIKLDEAIAYQVDGGEVIPLNWTGSYEHVDGTSYVKFEFEDYDDELPLVFQIGYPAMLMPMGNGLANMEWSTYSSSTEGDQLECVEVDEIGDPYYCGYNYQQYYPIAQGIISFPPLTTDPPGVYCGVTLKYNHLSKQILWGTYVGGNEDFNGSIPPKTEAHKLAVYTGALSTHQYVFVTGSTTCADFLVSTEELSPFSIAEQEAYEGGLARMWIGAFQKLDGVKHWATTHGESEEEASWREHGLAVAVNDAGKLVVGGMMESYGALVPVTPNFQTFPPTTPSGAFSRAVGDGFFIEFDEDYQIEWSTAFCEFSGPAAYGRIADMRLVRSGVDGHDAVWIVGASIAGTTEPLDLVEPPTGGYFQSTPGHPSAVIGLINLEDHVIDYCTRWGSPNDGDAKAAAYGVHVGEEGVYVVGFTNANDLTSAELPPPVGGGSAHWTTTNASNLITQRSDGFILRFKGYLDDFELDYGTLFGGNRDDVLFDVTGDGGGRIYITGESRSTGLAQNLDPEYYYQPFHDYVDRRDAIIFGMEDLPHPNVIWRTAFGGSMSDRGWGIAATRYEVNLCGATSSSMADLFPLQEFDADSEIDWYFDVFFGGTSSHEFVPWCSFSQAMDYEQNSIQEFLESYSLQHDGFMASFRIAEEPVAVQDDAFKPALGQLLVWPMSGGGMWNVRVPHTSSWSLFAYDASGRCVGSYPFMGTSTTINMGMLAPGLYSLRAEDAVGTNFVTKFMSQ